MTNRAEPDIGTLIRETVEGLTACGHCPIKTDRDHALDLRGQRQIVSILDDLIALLFPGCHGSRHRLDDDAFRQDLGSFLEKTLGGLRELTRHAFYYACPHPRPCEECGECKQKADDVVAYLVRSLPHIQCILERDIKAAYEGDPAARSTMEVVMSYPGVQAVIVHRIAHLLYKKQVPLIPRMMAEHAHSKTGIDIHPGASIGPGFFIDHGTAVVIGETCVIGKNVKLYQGVTLGALSFEKDQEGRLVKGVKRHPNVEDGVVIYAGATILGGGTRIGANSVIGGNVWLTHSIPAGSMVYNQQPRPLIKAKDGSWKVANGPWNDHGAGI